MLSGILAAQPFRTPHLRRRIALAPAHAAHHEAARPKWARASRAREDQFPPLEIEGGALRPIDYTLPVASAQVKTCVLFAGLFAEGETSVTEPVRSRDHTEIALREFGAEVAVEGGRITLAGRPRLHGPRTVRALATFPRRRFSWWPRCWCPARAYRSAAWD